MKPIEFLSEHRAKWSELDPYGHLNNQHYLGYFMEHRFIGLRKHIGLDIDTIRQLPVGMFVKSVNINYLRPVKDDNAFTITSSVQEFTDDECQILCEMKNEAGKVLSNCNMKVTCVDAKTGRKTNWPADFVSRFYVEGENE